MGTETFEGRCLYIPVAPADAIGRTYSCPSCGWEEEQLFQKSKGEPHLPSNCPKCSSEIEYEDKDDSKSPNRTDSWDGPTIRMWEPNGNGCYTWDERQKTSWNRWGIVDWSGPERLLIIDADLYKMKKDKKEEVFEAIKDLNARVHRSKNGGAHAFLLVDKADLNNGSLPISLCDHIDDKLNGYVLDPECEGYEVINDVMPRKINPDDIPEPIKAPRPKRSRVGGRAREVEIPTELEDDLPCWRELSKTMVKSGRRRYACMVLAGHLRDKGVPKSVVRSFIRDYWKKLPQPPEADSKRPWSDIERVIGDIFKKGYRIGCRTVNRYFSEMCKPKKCPVDRETTPKRENDKNRSKLDKLIEIGERSAEEFFIDERDKACALIDGGGHAEAHQISSKFFRQYLGKKFYEQEGRGVSEDMIKNAINTLAAEARFGHKTKKRRLHNRIAEHEGAIYYDLSDDLWNAIKITEEGWELEKHPPTIFRRLRVHEEQIEPERGGNLDEIFEFTNIQGEEDRLLFKVNIVSQFIPNIPHPITILRGPHGSVKTFTQWAVAKLVDPSKLEDEEMSLPTKGEQAHLHLYWFYVLRYGNVSTIPGWLSDFLCRASTGGGHVKRELYTDEDPRIYSYKRAVWINGIELSPSKPDFRDRSLTFDLSVPENFKQERYVRSEFQKKRPRLLGAIFDVLSKALKLEPEVEAELEGVHLPRMADFAVMGEAISRAMGYEENGFLNAYLEKRGEQRLDVLEQNPIGSAVLLLIEDTKEWEGSPKELLEALEEIAEEHKLDTDHRLWPKSPSWVTRRIGEIKTELREEGVEFTTEHDGRKRRILLSPINGTNGIYGNNSISDDLWSKKKGEFIKKEGTRPYPKGVRNAVNGVYGVREEENHICELCMEEFGVKKPATTRTGTREHGLVWVCEDCIQEMGQKNKGNENVNDEKKYFRNLGVLQAGVREIYKQHENPEENLGRGEFLRKLESAFPKCTRAELEQAVIGSNLNFKDSPGKIEKLGGGYEKCDVCGSPAEAYSKDGPPLCRNCARRSSK